MTARLIITRGAAILSLVFLMLLMMGEFTPTRAADEMATTCNQYYAGITNRIAGCVRDSLAKAAENYFDTGDGFYAGLQLAIQAVMTISVAVFGCMAAFGMLEKPGRDSLMLLIKLACVAYFVTASDTNYQMVIRMMDGSARAVLQMVPRTGQADNSGTKFDQITCFNNLNRATEDLDGEESDYSPYMQTASPWLAFDCLLDSVIGIKPKDLSKTGLNGINQAFRNATNTGEQGLARGLFNFFFASFQSSVMGAMLAIIGFVFVWSMINMIVKALFVYLAGYIGVTMMMIVGPLFIPLILFQATRSYFDKWIKLVFSFALQPIIILAFIVFSIAAVDLAMFSGSYSVMYRIAGDASRETGFSLNAYLTQIREIPNSDPPATGAILRKSAWTVFEQKALQPNVKAPVFDETKGALGVLGNSKCLDHLMKADPELAAICSQSFPLQINKDEIDWTLLAAVRTPPVELDQQEKDDGLDIGGKLAREIMAAMLFAGIVVYVMNELLTVVPAIAYDMFGDYGQSANLAQMSDSPGGQKVGGGIKSMMKGGG